jgi:hypothetical protein
LARKVAGKTLAIGFLVVLVGFVALVFWIGLTGDSHHIPPSAPGIAFTTDPTAVPGIASAAVGALGVDAGALERTVHDRRTRDEIRRRLLAAWAQGEGEPAAAARQGRFEPMPERDGGGVDPKYIQSVVRGEYMPLAKSCYEELLSRKKDAAGTITAKFSIVGDESVGGIVDDVTIDVDGGLADEGLVTCLRESLLAVAFRPPNKRGMVTVHYPIMMSPDEPDGGSE